jgi:isopentenyl phosphate kinase
VDKRRVVVKLGGSIVSDKRKDFSYRAKEVVSIARAISSAGVEAVVVHGGGAFGHPVARKYGLSSRAAKASSEGVGETRRAMLDLNVRVCDSLLSGGLRPYTFSPFPLLETAGRRGAIWLDGLMARGLTPVTFGDVVLDRRGFTIISGDTIALRLSKLLDAERCVFVMDVDGVMGSRGLLKALDEASASSLDFSGSHDATGGMGLKVKEALRIASAGTEVAFVSGFRPAEIAKALKGKKFHGTTVKVPSREKER